MKKTIVAFLLATTAFTAAAAAQEVPVPKPLSVTVKGIEDGKPVADKFARCIPDGKGQYKEAGGDISPAISWSGAPSGTKSYAVIVLDKDVPASFESANKPGQTLAADFPRQNFYHWV